MIVRVVRLVFPGTRSPETSRSNQSAAVTRISLTPGNRLTVVVTRPVASTGIHGPPRLTYAPAVELAVIVANVPLVYRTTGPSIPSGGAIVSRITVTDCETVLPERSAIVSVTSCTPSRSSFGWYVIVPVQNPSTPSAFGARAMEIAAPAVTSSPSAVTETRVASSSPRLGSARLHARLGVGSVVVRLSASFNRCEETVERVNAEISGGSRSKPTLTGITRIPGAFGNPRSTAPP